MENQYLDEGWNNRPDHRVYGFNLRPFCLYYLHLMQSIDSPLLRADRPFGPNDLLIASEICSAPWSEEGYTLDRIFNPSRFRKRRNQLRIVTERFLKQRDAWVAYYGDYLVLAEKWEDTGETYDEFNHIVSSKKKFGRTDLDRVMATATAIVFASGWSEEKVMMMPIGKAFGWADYFAIQQGAKIQFKTAKEQAMIEADRRRKLEEKEAG